MNSVEYEGEIRKVIYFEQSDKMEIFTRKELAARYSD